MVLDLNMPGTPTLPAIPRSLDTSPESAIVVLTMEAEAGFARDALSVRARRRASDEHLTRTGVALGSVDYIAPEQAQGADVDARADIYSLACILYEMLTGSVVFDREGDLEKLWAHVHDPPRRLVGLNPELPPGLQDVLDRALAEDPGDGQQSATQLAQDAEDALRQG